MSILATILGGGALVSSIVELADKFLRKEITKAEFDAQVKMKQADTEARVEEAAAKAASDRYESLMATYRASKAMQRTFAAVLFGQFCVLLWYQLGAPAYLVITGVSWPSPGVTLEWAYALVSGMAGVGLWAARR